VLCTKLDAECDRQATVVGRLLTTFSDGRRAVGSEIILSSEAGEKLQRELRLCLEILEFRICLINILQLQGALFPRPEALGPVVQWRHDHGPYALARSPAHAMTV